MVFRLFLLSIYKFYSEPEVEWFKNGDRVYPNDRVRIDIEPNGLLRLTISDITPDDVGKYTCRIFNQHGDDSCHADLVYDSETIICAQLCV